MEFTLHNSYVIPESVPSTVFFSGQSSAADANKAMLSNVDCTSLLFFCVVFFVLFVFVLCLVYQILSVSVDLPFLIVPSFSLAFIYRYIVCEWGKWIKQKGTEISVNSLWLFHFTTCFCLNFVRLLHLLVTVLPDKAWVSFYDFSIDLALWNLNQFNSLDIKKPTTGLLWKTYAGQHHFTKRGDLGPRQCLIQPLSTHFCFFYLLFFDYT
jgi:hypothetical protein